MTDKTGKRILVADDEAQYRDPLKNFFEGLGYIVDTAANYVDTQDLLDKHAYTLIVSDNGMPLGGESKPHRTCGLQLLAHAKAHGHNQQTPFVLNTGDDLQDTIAITGKLGGIYHYKYNSAPTGPMYKKLLGLQ